MDKLTLLAQSGDLFAQETLDNFLQYEIPPEEGSNDYEEFIEAIEVLINVLANYPGVK